MKTFFLSLLLLCSFSAAHAQDKKAQDAARRLQAANQRLASDKAALERDKAQLAQKLGELEKSGAAAEKAAARLKGAARNLEAERAALEIELGEALEREDELAAKLAGAEKALAEARQEGEQLRRRVANQQQTIGFWQEKTGACGTKNEELSKVGNELVERYRAKTCGDVGLDNEPLLGIGRARMENLLEGYKERIRAQSVEVQK